MVKNRHHMCLGLFIPSAGYSYVLLILFTSCLYAAMAHETVCYSHNMQRTERLEAVKTSRWMHKPRSGLIAGSSQKNADVVFS